jgi:molybdate transport system permease protein
MDWTPLWLTLQLAIVTTVFLFLVSLPLSYWLAHTRWKAKPIIEAIVSLPLVLPPTVLGFYMLLAFSPANGFGAFMEDYLNLRLVFSFEGLVLGSMLYSLPFMVHPIQAGFAQLPTTLTEAAFVLGKTKWQTLWQVQLPNMRSALLTAIVLSFAHTIGEFGVVLMIGGNIEGQTKVASIAIYDEVESLNYVVAHQYALVLFLFSFAVLFLVYWKGGKQLNYFNA